MLINVTSATTTVLNVLGEGNGDIRVRITNNRAAGQTVSVLLTDGTADFYIIKNLVMPEATAILLDNMRYDPVEHSCEIVTTGTTDITISTLFA